MTSRMTSRTSPPAKPAPINTRVAQLAGAENSVSSPTGSEQSCSSPLFDMAKVAEARASLGNMRGFLSSFTPTVSTTATADDAAVGSGPGSPKSARRRTYQHPPRASTGVSGGGGIGGGIGGARAGRIAAKKKSGAPRPPRPYKPERGLDPKVARARERLASRFSALGFPREGCLQALKESQCDVDQTCKLLLYYYPKGEGVRNMVKSLVRAITNAETKLSTLLDEIKKTMDDGTVEERLVAVMTHFEHCDRGNTGCVVNAAAAGWAAAVEGYGA